MASTYLSIGHPNMRPRPAAPGRFMSSTVGGGSGGGGGPAGPAVSMPRARPTGSLQEAIAQRHAPYSRADAMPLSAYLTGHNPRTDATMNVSDATNAGYQVQPWAPSSGAGPGSRGYRGSGHIQGYSDESQGTGADYIRQNGGLSAPKPSLLNDFYLNQPGVTQGAFDRLQAQKAMDETDPIASFYQNKSAVASGARDYGQAGFWQQMLQDQLAQRQAMNSSGSLAGGMIIRRNPDGSTSGMSDLGEGDGVGTPAYHAPGETRFDPSGNEWRWNESSGHGDLIRRAPTFADTLRMRQQAEAPQTTWEEGANLGEGILHTQFGDTGVHQGASADIAPTGATFTNGQGSAGPGGVQFTGRRGTQSAVDFFRDAANRQGANRFSQPEPGFQGIPMTQGSPSWRAYESAMSAKKALGKK